MGSGAELETQLILSDDLGYIGKNTTQNLLSELDRIGRMLRGLAKSIEKRRHV
jgi:four helix bundle protein